jgi:hypothetical protein
MGHAIALQAVTRSTSTAIVAGPVSRRATPARRIDARRPGALARTAFDAHGSSQTAQPPTQRRSRAAATRVMLQVTLDETLLDAFRRAMFGARDGLIQLLRVQPDPRHTQRVKVWLGLDKPALQRVIELVLATLPEAEIGRLAPA